MNYRSHCTEEASDSQSLWKWIEECRFADRYAASPLRNFPRQASPARSSQIPYRIEMNDSNSKNVQKNWCRKFRSTSCSDCFHDSNSDCFHDSNSDCFHDSNSDCLHNSYHNNYYFDSYLYSKLFPKHHHPHHHSTSNKPHYYNDNYYYYYYHAHYSTLSHIHYRNPSYTSSCIDLPSYSPSPPLESARSAQTTPCTPSESPLPAAASSQPLH